MQLAVSEEHDAMLQGEEPRGFLPGIAARHLRLRRHATAAPAPDALSHDRSILLALLNEALASEIACTLRYRRHFHLVQNRADAKLQGELLDRANEEQRHADLIAERIVQLGGEPDLSLLGRFDRHADYARGATLADMVREQLAAERLAIQMYAEILRYVGRSDLVTRRLLEEILAEERAHVTELASMLDELQQQTNPA